MRQRRVAQYLCTRGVCQNKPLHVPSAALRVAFDHRNYSSFTTTLVYRPQRSTVFECSHRTRRDIMLHCDNSVCTSFTTHAPLLSEPHPPPSSSRVAPLHTTTYTPHEGSTLQSHDLGYSYQFLTNPHKFDSNRVL